jgi:hypothetical protein
MRVHAHVGFYARRQARGGSIKTHKVLRVFFTDVRVRAYNAP